MEKTLKEATITSMKETIKLYDKFYSLSKSERSILISELIRDKEETIKNYGFFSDFTKDQKRRVHRIILSILLRTEEEINEMRLDVLN